MSSDPQVNVRLEPELNEWLEERAGGSRGRADFIRGLLVRERARDRTWELRRMFDHAAAEVDEEERADREWLLEVYSGGEEGVDPDAADPDPDAADPDPGEEEAHGKGEECP